MWKKVNLVEKKTWRRWPVNAARFFEIWQKSEKSLSLHKSEIWPRQTDPMEDQLFAKKSVK